MPYFANLQHSLAARQSIAVADDAIAPWIRAAGAVAGMRNSNGYSLHQNTDVLTGVNSTEIVIDHYNCIGNKSCKSYRSILSAYIAVEFIERCRFY